MRSKYCAWTKVNNTFYILATFRWTTKLRCFWEYVFIFLWFNQPKSQLTDVLLLERDFVFIVGRDNRNSGKTILILFVIYKHGNLKNVFPVPWEKSRVTAAVALLRDKKSLLLKLKIKMGKKINRKKGNLMLSGKIHRSKKFRNLATFKLLLVWNAIQHSTTKLWTF